MNDAHKAQTLCALSNREIYQAGFQPETGTITQGWFSDKFDDNWVMHMFTGHKYTSGRHDKEGCLSTEILIKNY